ncbi:MAG: hypothetical protein KGJ86_00015 [Chloroflexota bacterium]|nr:hypothetical protein [Chloroflexota bacterium]
MSDHVWNQVEDDLSSWINDTADSVAKAMAGGSHSPFAADITEQQKLDYYRGTLFNPDGSPNVAARQSLLDRAGIKGYAQVMNALGKQSAGMPDHPLQAQFADQELAGEPGQTPDVPQEEGNG